ncbi:MAG: WG repeat-containing protein [Eubacteriales bacterium]|nr:WG repeat-containing protein [Eubacteriales bacterium]
MKYLKVLCLLFCVILLLSGCKSKSIDLPSDEDDFINEENTDDETNPTESVVVQTEDNKPKIVAATPDEPVAVAKGKDNFLYGYINTKGEWVIAPQYGQAYPFCNNVATVCTDSRNPEWLLIDKSNNVLGRFAEGTWIFPVYIKSITEDDTDLQYTIIEDMIIITDTIAGFNFKSGFANNRGEVVVEPKYTKVSPFSDGLAAVNFGTEAEPSWGYIDKNGNTVIAPQYTNARQFSDGLAYVENQYDSNPEMRCGYIDKTGKMIVHGNWVEQKYGLGYMTGFNGSGTDFNAGVAAAFLAWESNANPGYDTAQGIGIIDKSGNVLFKDESGELWPYPEGEIGEGLFAICGNPGSNGDTPVGFIETSGNIVIAPQMQWKVYQTFCEGLCAVSFRGPEGRKGYIDKSGNLVIEAKYIYAANFSHGYAAVCEKSNDWLYIDKAGEIAVTGDFISAGYSFTK